MPFIYIGNEIQPISGAPTAGHINALSKIINRIRKISCDGQILVSDVGGGLSFSLAKKSDREVGNPWDISIVSGVATFSNCCARIGTQTVFLDDQTMDLPSSGTDTFIGYEYDSNAENKQDAFQLVTGANGITYDNSYIELSRYDRVPLYRIKRLSESATWSVAVDLRNMPRHLIFNS